MPTKYKDYPIYTYDEPAVYSDFTGGINTDPSNEHLLETEMRDCVNMTYLSGALVKRKGAKKIASIVSDEDITNIQGIFLFTYRLTYIIVAANGKLYQGIYQPNTEIKLEYLPIKYSRKYTNKKFDEENAFEGLPILDETEIQASNEGYISTYYTNPVSKKEFNKVNRGSLEDFNSGYIRTGDTFTYGIYEYVATQNFTIQNILPTSSNQYWEEVQEIPQDTMSTFDASTIMHFNIGDYVLYNNKIYQCKKEYTNISKDAALTYEYLIESFKLYTYNLVETSYLHFQNNRKIEAATYNNKLYIATGTRIVEVDVYEGRLRAQPIKPYLCNMTEVKNLGYNLLSPYPEQAIASQKDTVTTGVSFLKVEAQADNKYTLIPIVNVQLGDNINNYKFRWEKYINNQWVVIVPFTSQDLTPPQTTISVDDADRYQYRVTMAQDFENANVTVAAAEDTFDYTKDYAVNDMVVSGGKVYICIYSKQPSQTIEYTLNNFSQYATVVTEGTEGEDPTRETKQIWMELYNSEVLPFLDYDTETGTTSIVMHSDYTIDKTGGFFGSATSVLFNKNLGVSDSFTLIHSCTKIVVDGEKLLFYDDAYNSGMWFKTIIKNPGYITNNGNLSFKTTKNESVIKVVPFQGNILVFANADNVGGSIHLVSGNGDDYNDESGYYSPYKRSTINSSISCDNANTIQVCDNIIVFKYFNRIYYINASDLSNDVVKVTSCNDRIMSKSPEVEIPWDNNDCISEVTDTYYALIWKKEYEYDEVAEELILKHPGLKVKLYYKMSKQLEDGSFSAPWLRDESNYFNVDNIVYIKGKPIYLYNNLLISMDEDTYEDMGEVIETKVHFRGYDNGYPKNTKLLNNILVYYHRNQYNKIDFSIKAFNEAGHLLLDSDKKNVSLQDARALKEGMKISQETTRVGSTIVDSKVFNSKYSFPYLLIDSVITSKNKGEFSISSITYNYTSTGTPDITQYDLYSKIIRPKEI